MEIKRVYTIQLPSNDPTTVESLAEVIDLWLQHYSHVGENASETIARCLPNFTATFSHLVED